ncbi:MAG: hypothetical protein K2P53_02000 [Rickettsiales bacterium]|nr:hypothetical protein [Rickettsiales bacterium]
MSKERIWYSLSDIFVIKINLINFLTDVKKQYKTFLKAKDDPYSVDDALIDKMYKSVVQQSKDIKLYDEQVQKWLIEVTKISDKKEIEKLRKIVSELYEINKKLLDICDYLKDKTIDSIMNMDDFELGLQALTGDMLFPKKKG